jgi:hypothetical protein
MQSNPPTEEPSLALIGFSKIKSRNDIWDRNNALCTLKVSSTLTPMIVKTVVISSKITITSINSPGMFLLTVFKIERIYS